MNEIVKEILLILQEEASEVALAVSKCQRFGPDQMHPAHDYTNMQHLEEELGDILAMIELLVDSNVGITNAGIEAAKLRKFTKLSKWSTIPIDK